MVQDNRMVTKAADGTVWVAPDAASFDFSQFYTDMLDAEKLQVSRDEVAWMKRYVKPARKAEVTLNLSCGVQTVPHVMMLQIELFKRLGVDFVATAGSQFCCGRPFQRYPAKAQIGDRMAASAVKRLESLGGPTNVQCCGSCFIEFDYHVSRIEEETGEAPFEVVHITKFLRDRLAAMGDSVPWVREVPHRVLLHAEGEEVHPSKADHRDWVIETLDMMPGIEFVGIAEPPSFGLPCATTVPGGPSVLNDLTPEQYRQVQDEFHEQLRAAGADAILTHHHMCHREWGKFSSVRAPVLHYQGLMAEALGCSVPDRFKALWQLGDPERILERSRPQWESWDISEPEARDLVRRLFVPKYADAIQRCPCEGTCAINDLRPQDDVCTAVS